VTGADFPKSERLAWLRPARTETVGPVAFQHLIGRFGSARTALDALPALARRAGRSTPPTTPTREEAEAEISDGDDLGATLLCAGEPDYPAALKTLDPPPPVIWALGDIALLRRRAVGIVGARVASASGCRFARGLAGELGQAGLMIASGLARGIDAAAHEGALATGTVAVLGGGVADIYPPENEALYRRIAREGCILSESAPRRRAQAKDFPRRNRLISGLSLAVVVVEAELKSGSLITARLAAEQGRELLAVPVSPLDPRARGCNDLIRQGAAVCEGRTTCCMRWSSSAASAPRRRRRSPAARTKRRASCWSGSGPCSPRRRCTSTNSPARSARPPARCSRRWWSSRWPAARSSRVARWRRGAEKSSP
jgi:DNA processing protein